MHPSQPNTGEWQPRAWIFPFRRDTGQLPPGGAAPPHDAGADVTPPDLGTDANDAKAKPHPRRQSHPATAVAGTMEEHRRHNPSSSSGSRPFLSGLCAAALRRKPLGASASTAASGEGLVRQLGVLDLVLLGIGASIGAGIFVVTGTVARDAGPGQPDSPTFSQFHGETCATLLLFAVGGQPATRGPDTLMLWWNCHRLG
jgi:hypothetical protein